MMISYDLFEICLVGIRTLVRSYINKRALNSDWESNLSSPTLYCEVVYVALVERLSIR